MNMSPTSPLVIIVYVILAILFASTMLRRFTRGKLITSILRSPPRNINRTIKSYKTIVKMYKILIVGYCVLIPLLVYLHFGPENGEGFLLFVVGVIVLMLIKAIEDIQYRNTVIARLEAELPTVRQVDVASEEVFEARARKWRAIAMVIALVCMVAVLLAFYVTMGGPWWFYLIASILMLLAIAWGFWLAYKQE
jgi:ABC-type multidrug transport system fused ATPase/permease subunit